MAAPFPQVYPGYYPAASPRLPSSYYPIQMQGRGDGRPSGNKANTEGRRSRPSSWHVGSNPSDSLSKSRSSSNSGLGGALPPAPPPLPPPPFPSAQSLSPPGRSSHVWGKKHNNDARIGFTHSVDGILNQSFSPSPSPSPTSSSTDSPMLASRSLSDQDIQMKSPSQQAEERGDSANEEEDFADQESYEDLRRGEEDFEGDDYPEDAVSSFFKVSKPSPKSPSVSSSGSLLPSISSDLSPWVLHPDSLTFLKPIGYGKQSKNKHRYSDRWLTIPPPPPLVNRCL